MVNKTIITLLFLLCISSLFAQELTLEGRYIRVHEMGAMALDFKKDGSLEVDFRNDSTVDVVSQFSIDGDIVSFTDKEGMACPNVGKYKLYKTDYYISLDLVDDMCGGRIKPTMGFWVKPNNEELIAELSKKIEDSPEPEYYLSRARIYMALGKINLAKSDFDVYLDTVKDDARAYINRAGIKFPFDMNGVIEDCNKAIQLDPENKNAYFLRGLALSRMNKKEEACNDFYKAIELGFEILQEVEKRICSEFWEKLSETK